jgi:poly(A) polymerase
VGALLDVHPLAVELGERFRAGGHELHLVGGAVRDEFLHRTRAELELDLATDAHPDRILELIRGWADTRYLQGVRFGTVGAFRDGVRLEITTYRREVYPGDDRHPRVTFGDDLETDLSRRDFTVNAMAVRLPERTFVDPFGGVRDLAAKRLDTPLDPAVAFSDDPLRMLRAARFAAELDLTPVPRVIEAMRAMAERLDIVSAERIQGELSRLLVAERPSIGLELLVRTGLADRFVPELSALELEQDPVHRHKDVLRHTYAVVERCRPDLVLRLAALLHDIGKPATRAFTEDGVQFHHHEVVGARMAADRLRALRYPNETVAAVTRLIELHLRFHTFGTGWTDAAVRRYLVDAGPQLDDLNQLTRADCTTRNAERARMFAELQDELELRIARLLEEEGAGAARPPIDGNRIMEHLGIGAGPTVGEAWRYLRDQRLDRGPMSEDEALALLDDWAKEHVPRE